MIDLPEGTNLPREYREVTRWEGADGATYLEIERKRDREAITFRLGPRAPHPVPDIIAESFRVRDRFSRVKP